MDELNARELLQAGVRATVRELLDDIESTKFFVTSASEDFASFLTKIEKTGLISLVDIDKLMLWPVGTAETIRVGGSVTVSGQSEKVTVTSCRPLLWAILTCIAERQDLRMSDILEALARKRLEAEAAEAAAQRQAEVDAAAEAARLEEFRQQNPHLIDPDGKEPDLEKPLIEERYRWISFQGGKADGFFTACTNLGRLSALTFGEILLFPGIGTAKSKHIAAELADENLQFLQDVDNVPEVLQRYRKEVLEAMVERGLLEVSEVS